MDDHQGFSIWKKVEAVDEPGSKQTLIDGIDRGSLLERINSVITTQKGLFLALPSFGS
jgi:hypothetical protein